MDDSPKDPKTAGLPYLKGITLREGGMKIRLILCLPLLLIGLTLQAQQPQLETHEAWADTDTLMIRGRDFGNGGVLEVPLPAGITPVPTQ
jgi:hypothetical protein